MISKGTYCLVIDLSKDAKVRVGSLGSFVFPKGAYVYVGSALNGLQSRLQRHWSRPEDKTLHWHIDFLLANPNAKLVETPYIESPMRLECTIARSLSEKGRVVVKGFGASDCSCDSHLFCFPSVKKAVNAIVMNP